MLNNSISIDTAKNIIDYIVSIDSTKKINCDSIRVIFFGGEPLMNFDILKYITTELISRISNYKLEFSISTNGVLLLPDVNKFLCENNFSIQLSFEGDSDIQGKSRPYVGGHNSYEAIIRNISSLSNEAKKQFTIAMTVSKLTGDISIIMKKLMSEGFRSFNLLFVTDDVIGVNNLQIEDYAYIESVVRSAMKIVTDSIKSGDFVNIHPLSDNLMLLDTRTSYGNCNSSVTVEAFGTDGRVYQCQRFLSMSDSSYGNVGKKFDCTKLNEIRTVNSLGRFKCYDCWLDGICPGKCAFLQKMYEMDSDISQTSCIIQHILWSEVIGGYITLKEEAPNKLHEHLFQRSK